MIGFPWENKDDMLNTINFAKSLKPDRIIFSIVTPYPGTELYEYCLQAFPGKIPKNTTWEEFFHQSGKIVLPEMSKEDFYETIEKLEKEILIYMFKKRILDYSFISLKLKEFLKNPKKFFSQIKHIF
jgi:hypothetical protein